MDQDDVRAARHGYCLQPGIYRPLAAVRARDQLNIRAEHRLRSILLPRCDDNENRVDRLVSGNRVMGVHQDGRARNGAILLRHMSTDATALASSDDQGHDFGG